MRKIRTSKKGFTLAELLIVVAIIGVLVGISIPIFSAQLRKSKLATNQANARAAYAAVSAGILDSGFAGGTGTYSVDSASLGSAGVTKSDATIDPANVSDPIKDWGVDDKIGTTTLGDDIKTSWTVTIDKNGNVQFS